MKETVLETLKSSLPNFEKLVFATLFVKGIYNTNGELVENGISQRYITVYSEDRSNLEIALMMIKELFGEVFEYDQSESGEMCESEDSMDNVLLHRRSRVVSADKVIAVFKKVETDNNIGLIYDYLLKTNFVLEVKTLQDETGISYVARTQFRPSTADIVTDSGVLLYPNMTEAIRKVLASPHCPYNEVIDDYFDTIVIDSPVLQCEISPTKDADELLRVITSKILEK